MNVEVRTQALNAALAARRGWETIADILAEAKKVEDYLSGRPTLQTVNVGAVIGGGLSDVARLGDLAKVAGR